MSCTTHRAIVEVGPEPSADYVVAQSWIADDEMAERYRPRWAR